MRRNDYDVTDTIRTTDPKAVGAEVERIYLGLYNSPPTRLQRAFRDAAKLYRGEDPEYLPCDTGYHDLQHVLDVTLAMARLMDGYQRGGRQGSEKPLPRDFFVIGILAALFHDFGYLRRRNDRRHRYGAEYTLIHVSRGAAYLRGYARSLGLHELARTGSILVHYTGYERAAETIRIADPLLRRVGHMLGTADIIAQMSDRCYLEKCRDRLYPEFVLGGLAVRKGNGRKLPNFTSSEDLLHKTPEFYEHAQRRLDVQLSRAYEYATVHFGGRNPYIEEMQKNVRHAQELAKSESMDRLRRSPPTTLVSS